MKSMLTRVAAIVMFALALATCDDERPARKRDVPELVTMPGGRFTMGTNDGLPEDGPPHAVRVRAFDIAVTEITVRMYAKCVDAGECQLPHSSSEDPDCNYGRPNRLDHPINCIEWENASECARWLGARLPTEAEWEYAARSAGRDVTFPWGNVEATCDRANMGGNARETGCRTGNTAEVCSRPAGNTTGPASLCDMAGNVLEWVEDDLHNGYVGAPADGSAWIDRPTRSERRVIRGGGFDGTPYNLRTTSRTSIPAEGWGTTTGFRMARSAWSGH